MKNNRHLKSFVAVALIIAISFKAIFAYVIPAYKMK